MLEPRYLEKFEGVDFFCQNATHKILLHVWEMIFIAINAHSSNNIISGSIISSSSMIGSSSYCSSLSIIIIGSSSSPSSMTINL